MKNKNLISVSFILFVLVIASINAYSQKQEFENSITEEDLKRHLTIISADDMQGRDTGSEGQKKAGEYIVNHFKSIGLQPIVKSEGNSGSYYQKVLLYKTGWKDAFIKVNDSKKVFFKDYFPVGLVNVPEEKTIETVFCGYGRKDNKFDDFKNKNISGKAVVFWEGSSDNSPDWEGQAGSRKKQKIASELGAAFVFEISKATPEKFNTLNAERKAVLSRFNRLALEKSDSEKPSSNPTFVISKNLGAEMLGIGVKKLEKHLKNPQSKISSKKTQITLKSERGQEPLESANILGFLEGTDKKDEVIVVTAHYDHVGVDEKGNIYNGADDDGSGTCAVLELAEAFSLAAQKGHRPRRSILFMTVTGEEKGLLGSRYYTDIDPVIPLSQTMANLNIDMIGRVDKKHESNPNYVYIIGSDKLSSDLHKISENANKESVNFELDYEYNDANDPNRFYYRSDHYNFAKNKIPVIFYFTGVHEDYHKPGDDVEKIMFPKYSKIVKLIYNTLWDLSNIDTKIVVDSNKP